MNARKICLFGFAAAIITSGSSLAGVRYGERNLVDYARRTDAGAIDVISRAGEDGACWDNSVATNAFDGDVTTYFDPKWTKWDTYVGYDLTTPCHLTRVRFHGRNIGSEESYLTRCCVTGIETNGQPFAETTDFFRTRDIVPSDWRTSAPDWFEVVPKAATRDAAYLGFRFGERSSYGYIADGKTFCGNVSELEFYGMTDESYKAFDGDRDTSLALAAGDTVESNFGATVPIAEVRVVYASAAAVGDKIEVSLKDNFSSRTTVYAVTAAPAVGTAVTYTLFNVSGKCVRYVSKNGGAIAEIAFIPASQVSNASFTRKLSDAYDPYFALRFTPAPGNGGTTKVFRGPGRGGPWELAATLAEGASWWNDTAQPQTAGAVYYYRFVNAYPFDGGEVEMSDEATVVRAPIRDEHLERTADCLTQLAPGRSIIANCGQKCWSPSTSTDWAVITNSMRLAFDNDLTGQFTDIQKKDPHTALGVDFGEPCRFTRLRLYYNNAHHTNSNRINNVKFAGSNNANWVKDGNFTVLTEDFTQQGIKRWYEKPCLTDEPFRFAFVYNSRDNAWGCNAGELQFFGYRAAALEGFVAGVENFRLVSVDAEAKVHLAWDAADFGGTYAVERRAADGAWEAIASGLSATACTDALTFDNAVYAYRVVTSRAGGTAYSETVRVQMYARGAGTGLYAQVTAPFASTGVDAASETTVLPAAAVGDVDFPAYANGAFAKWSGRLTVPVAGTYLIDCGDDEKACVWVDGSPVFHLAGASGGVTKTAVTLTAGEHDLVVTVLRNGAGERAALYWRGPIVSEEIPVSQLTPVAPAAMPDGWSTLRSFAGSADTYYPSDCRVNADGSIDAAFGGCDLWGKANGYAYTYKPVTGDFIFTARLDRDRGIVSSRKAGIMLRKSLDASAPFEAFLMQTYAESAG